MPRHTAAMSYTRRMATAEQVVADLRSVFLALIRTLVDDEDAVRIDSLIAPDGGTTFLVRVPRNDAGKLIGKQGRTARSLRVLLAAASMKYDMRFALDIQGEDIADEVA